MAGYFYRERETERAVHLYALLLRRRRRLPCLLRQLALAGRRRRLAAADAAGCSRPGRGGGRGGSGWLRTTLLRRCCVPPARCVVCGGDADARKQRACACGAAYCADCFADVGRTCPLCRHDNCRLDDDDYDDYDDCDDDASVDDALQAYCAAASRSSVDI